MIRSRSAVLLLASAVLAGCVLHGPVLTVQEAAPRRIELSATPFFPQERYQCGPAALATVLTASGVPVGPDELVTRVYLPQRQGSLQTELVSASRGYDRLAYRIDPEIGAIVAELTEGRPVLVLQNLGLVRVPVWHYAVVVGFDTESDQLVLRSGTTQRLAMPAAQFLKTWDRAGRWALVLVAPGEFPANPARESYLEAVAGLESAGRFEAALKSYAAAIARWPADSTALLGIGNVQYRKKALGQAAEAYRRVLEREPAHAVARNNLAQVLLEQGDAQAALREITTARQLLADQRLAPMLAETEADIRRALGGPSRP